MRRLRVARTLAVLTLAGGFGHAAACSEDTASEVDASSDATTPSPETSTDGAKVDASSADASHAEDADGSAMDARTTDASDAANGSDASDATDAANGLDAANATDAADASPAFDLYDPAVVPKFELTFDAAALAILSNPSTLDADRKKWAHGTFKCGATVIADVGVRRKGSSTFRALPQKAAFKIRFDKYVPGQRFAGLTELTLNNSMSDPTFLAERLAYYVFRESGLPAQRASSAQIEINGAPWGLYLNVETPNLDFIQRVFPGNARTLYEVTSGSQWLPGVEAGFEEEVGDGTKSDVTALLQSVQSASNATLLADVAGHLDTTEWLTFSAAEAATGHYDGYAFGIWGSHNYFMAGNTTGAFSLVPWSTDLTFSNRETVVNANVPLDTTTGVPTLLGRCKLSPGCWATYKTQVSAVLATFERLDLVNLAKAWHAQIDPLVVADPKREATLPYYTSETALLYTWIAARPGVVRAQLGIP